MIDLDSWQEVFATLRKNKLRTALTGLGVFLGIVILMAMVAFGRSLQAGVQKEIAGFATNAVFVWGQRTSEPFAGLPANRPIEFNNGDVEALRRVDGIEYLAPRNQLGGFMRGSVAKYGGKSGSFQVMGDYPDVQHVDAPLMLAGRFIDDLDIAERRKVTVIGKGIVEQLFPEDKNPIGEYVEINGVYFQVIGVFGSRQSGENGERKITTLHVPFSTFQQAFHMGDEVHWFAIVGRATESAATIEDKVRDVLRKRHKIAPDDEEAIGSFNAGKQFGKMTALFMVINFVMWTAGILTLAAGVIGVSNIMLISVRERTKEIGVRKALGARPLTVVRMIVAESTVLTVIAGYLGLVAGVGLVQGWIAILPMLGDDVPFGVPDINFTLALSAATVIAVFGIFAGVIPAYHAAKIEPVEALRTE